MEHIVSIPQSHTFNTEKKKSGLCYLAQPANIRRISVHRFSPYFSLPIFRRERSDDRKYLCCSQAILNCTISENAPFSHRVLRGYICSHYQHTSDSFVSKKSVNTYPICDYPLWRLARRSFAPSVTDIAPTRHQFGISSLTSQTSSRGETTLGVLKCRLFSQAVAKAIRYSVKITQIHERSCEMDRKSEMLLEIC